MEISVKEYASMTKVSIQAVYQQIKSGKLQTLKNKEGNTLIIIKDTLKQDEKTISVEVLLERVKNLEENLKKEVEARERAEADKKELYKQLEQSNMIQFKALETVKALEHKTEVIEEELIKEKSKTIWQRIFRK